MVSCCLKHRSQISESAKNKQMLGCEIRRAVISCVILSVSAVFYLLHDIVSLSALLRIFCMLFSLSLSAGSYLLHVILLCYFSSECSSRSLYKLFHISLTWHSFSLLCVSYLRHAISICCVLYLLACHSLFLLFRTSGLSFSFCIDLLCLQTVILSVSVVSFLLHLILYVLFCTFYVSSLLLLCFVPSACHSLAALFPTLCISFSLFLLCVRPFGMTFSFCTVFVLSACHSHFFRSMF